MAVDMNVPFLGRIPLEPNIVDTGDSGKPYFENYRDSETAKAFDRVVDPLLKLKPEIKPASSGG
jgi:ATP-binding protein involved in chromosome partitioning